MLLLPERVSALLRIEPGKLGILAAMAARADAGPDCAGAAYAGESSAGVRAPD